MKNKKLIDFLSELQRKIENEEEKKYSKIVIQEFKNPCNIGLLENPDAFQKIKGPCGDTMKIGLKIKDDIITDARFWTDGCGATIACGSMLTKMTIGLSVKNAKMITKDNLIKALLGLPDEHIHCAKLAASCLQNAIRKYIKQNYY
jgi:nitrogen fixation NifU-like protein